MTTGMPDFGALLAQAGQIQQQMMDAQAGLADVRVVGTSGGGLVSATVNGHGDLVALAIEPAAYDPEDPDALDTVADLVVAAVRDAKAESERRAAEQMSEASGGLTGLSDAPGVEFDFSALGALLPPGLLGAAETGHDETGEQPEDR